MKILGWAVASIALPASSPALAAPCAMTAQEKSWVDRSLAAWERVRTHRLKIPPQSEPVIVVFNGKCRFETRAGAKPRWRAEPHLGVIKLPNGGEVDAGVVSATMSNEKTGQPFFVMALPPIWETAKIIQPGDWDGLTGVFLHEFSHVTQAPVLKPFWDDAKARYGEPDGLNDDKIQELFGKDPAYVAVAEKEQDLFFKAAEEPDDAKAKALARQALALRDARQKRWFVGPDEVWTPYDDIFLTMEGYGQWFAYAWLSDPQGGGMTPTAAEKRMRGGRRWWSQDTGLSLFLLLDRFVPNWSAQAFATQPKLGDVLLRKALAETPPTT